MAKDFKNKIKRLELKNFTCFGKVAIDFSPGINVFIGENGTGKTHLLKVLYGILKSTQFYFTVTNQISGFNSDEAKAEFKNDLNIGLKNLFKTEELESLLRINDTKAKIKINFNYDDVEFSFLRGSESKLKEFTAHIANVIFIPSNEMLSWFEGFISSYENRESSIDETYYRLAKALDPLPLKGNALEEQNPLLETLEEAIRAKVLRKGNKFFVAFKDEQKEFSTPLVAQGINKIAQLIYLIMNGSLTKNTILFWDEPEANLNPKYILIVAKFLQTLANAGCQIFVATHDYLLPYELSLSKEYAEVAEGKVPDMKFFALYKGENGTEVEEGETMPDLKHDAIHEGLNIHQRREDRLFQKSLNIKT